MRDHQPIQIDQFNGLYARSDVESVPLDHFSECNNVQYIGPSGFGTRDGIEPHQDVLAPVSNILRMYNYPTETDGSTLLVLNADGEIWHIVNSTTVFGPILTIVGMTDFGFAPYSGRAYITPFTTHVVGSQNQEWGLAGDFLYVYDGAGTPARKAAGNGPTTNITVANGAAGHTDAGIHIFGYVYETDTGYLSPPGGLVAFTTGAALSVSFTTVANSPDAFVTKKHIVASKVIQAASYNGDVTGYDLFFIPGADIPNNVTTALPNISFYDADLLDDATHLLDNLTEVPAGVGLCVYHNRLCIYTSATDKSLVRVSAVGEPEAFSEISGICLVPPDGNPVTNAQELRDVLYVTKRNRTVSFVDNGDDPATWPLTVVDNAMGCGVHGIATVLDSGSSNVDYLIVGTFKGITLFNGTYILPELSWKVSATWNAQDFLTKLRIIQMVNDSRDQKIYCVLTDRSVLLGDYGNGFDPKQIRWALWTFDALVNALALYNINELLLGLDQT